MNALELSRLPDAKEDKTNDYDLIAAENAGAVKKFYDFNSSPHGQSSKKGFISNEDLLDAWKAAAAKDANLPKKAWWERAKNRKVGLKALFESSKVPSSFKLEVLKVTGFI